MIDTFHVKPTYRFSILHRIKIKKYNNYITCNFVLNWIFDSVTTFLLHPKLLNTDNLIFLDFYVIIVGCNMPRHLCCLLQDPGHKWSRESS